MLLLSLAAASYAPQPILSVVALPAASRARPAVAHHGPEPHDFYGEIDSHFRFLLGGDAVDRIASFAADDEVLNPVRAARDKMLAERDTRKWCLDRCLATGYCEAVEDLWKLTTQQVVQFCEKCAGEDACELAY